jgi:hypothetical protein
MSKNNLAQQNRQAEGFTSILSFSKEARTFARLPQTDPVAASWTPEKAIRHLLTLLGHAVGKKEYEELLDNHTLALTVGKFVDRDE